MFAILTTLSCRKKQKAEVNLKKFIKKAKRRKPERGKDMRYESKYVKKTRENSIEQYDSEMALRKFREEYKSQIENGLTLGQFRSTHQTTQEDEDRFQQIAEEVRKEQAQGEAFLKGFCGGK